LRFVITAGQVSDYTDTTALMNGHQGADWLPALSYKIELVPVSWVAKHTATEAQPSSSTPSLLATTVIFWLCVLRLVRWCQHVGQHHVCITTDNLVTESE
jgi:hypothetical protein